VDAHFDGIKETDVRRIKLLQNTRKIAPGWLMLEVRYIAHTALPRVVCSPTTWGSLVLYAIAATLRRMEIWTVTHNPAAVSGASLMMTFIIVFFLGYCYNRHYSQYFAAMKCCGSLIESCALARASMRPGYESRRAVHQIYRFLNLAHVCGYVGLTPVYNHENFLDSFIAEHGLLGEGAADPTERQLVEECGPAKGAYTYIRFINFALLELGSAVESKLITDVLSVEISRTILGLREGLATMYQYHAQVLPYMYVHLVSLMTTVFIAVFAVEKALLFSPDADYTYGLVLPFLAWTIMCCSCVGLIEVGQTLANPFGSELEDFAVYSFVNSATKNAFTCIDGEVPLSLQAKAVRPEGSAPPDTDAAGTPPPTASAPAAVAGSAKAVSFPAAAPAPSAYEPPNVNAARSMAAQNGSMIQMSRRASTRPGGSRPPPRNIS